MVVEQFKREIMNTPIIAFDEAGNTGQNLLDSSQPFFSLASVHFSDDEINELLSIFDTKSDELHFKRLRKYPKTRKQLLVFCDHELIDFSNVKFSIADKYYTVIAHIVDRLVEPVMYDSGVDIYKNGLSLSWTNMLYIMSRDRWDRNLFDKMLADFVKLINHKSDESIKKFHSTVSELYDSIDEDDESLISPILFSFSQIEGILEHVYKYSIDIACPSFTILCDWWHKELGQPFRIIHDQSKPIEYWKELIQFTANPDFMEEMEVGFGSRKMSYPLKISNLELVESKLFKQIQIADLVASAVAFGVKTLKNQEKDEFASELMHTKLFNIEHHSMVPSMKVTSQLGITEDNGINPLDYLAAMFQKGKSKFEKIFSNLKD